MVMKLVLLLAAVSAAVAVQNKEGGGSGRPNYDFVDYYDCSAKQNGLYVHPFDCTRFIICSNGNAADMACGDCDLNNVHQCAGSLYLMFDGTKDYCDWPSQSDCKAVGTTPEEPATTTTTTKKPDPTTAPATTRAPEPTTTRAPAPTTTTPPTSNQTCNGKKDGDSCDKEDCEQCGFCLEKRSFFLSCNRTFPSNPKLPITGVIVERACDGNLWWNPDAKPTDVEVGGTCDEWANLSTEVKNKYKSDPKCYKAEELCEYGQDESCSASYWFFDPVKSTEREHLNCSVGLLWDPKSETCRACEHVVNEDNSKCSC